MSALLLLTFTLVARAVWAQREGPALVDILVLPVGARAVSMGGAQVALAGGPDAPIWNPAGLAFLSSERAAVMASYSVHPWFSRERDLTFAAGAMRVERLGFVAVNVACLSYPDNPPPGDEDDRNELLASFAYGVPAGEEFAIGIAIKYIRIEHDVDQLDFGWKLSGSGAAFDVGLLWRSPEARLRAGINAQNLGPDLSLEDPRPPDDLPRNLKIGVGARVIEGDGGTVTLAFDADEALAGNRDWPRLRFGAEVAFRQLNTAVRAGWIYGGLKEEFAEESQASGGFGVGWRGIFFDYAASPWGPPWLDTHHFSAGVHF